MSVSINFVWLHARNTKLILICFLHMRWVLTYNIWENQPLFTSWKWNMDDFFGLKFHLWYVHAPRNFFFEIPSCGKHVIFVSEFDILIKNCPIYEVNQLNQKMVPAWRDFKKKLFVMHVLMINENLSQKFHTYSIFS